MLLTSDMSPKVNHYAWSVAKLLFIKDFPQVNGGKKYLLLYMQLQAALRVIA